MIRFGSKNETHVSTARLNTLLHRWRQLVSSPADLENIDEWTEMGPVSWEDFRRLERQIVQWEARERTLRRRRVALQAKAQAQRSLLQTSARKVLPFRSR